MTATPAAATTPKATLFVLPAELDEEAVGVAEAEACAE